MGASDDFDEQAQGELLLFSNEHNKALRLEVGYLKLEFTDQLYIGADPPGTLYYNKVGDLTAPGGHSYAVRGEQRKGKTWIIVDFTRNGTKYAVFEAKDQRNALQKSGMDGYSHIGTWTTLDRAYDNGARYKKSGGDNTVKLLLPGLNRQAQWSVGGSLVSQSFEIEGIASFKENFSTDLIHWAGSTADHLAFFENNVYSTELLAWFLPLITQPDIPGPSENYSGVVWSKIDSSKP